MSLSLEKLLKHREYNSTHRQEINKKSRLYRIQNEGLCKAYKDEYHKTHKKEESISRKDRRIKNIESWKAIIPNKTSCQICGADIYFKYKEDKIRSIHFDHRHEGKELIKESPSRWLKDHPRTPENEKIWRDCDFGMLCHFCNYKLPTYYRKDWVNKMNKYVSSIS